MKKNIFLGLVLAAVTAGGAFALPELKLSAGLGGYFTSDFGGGAEISAPGHTMSMKTPYVGGGGFAFFDATYAELSLGFWGGGGTGKVEESTSTDIDMSFMGLDIGLLGKYPFEITEKLSVFPLLGITYRVMLSADLKDENGDKLTGMNGDDLSAGDFSALWFKLGGGVDFSITDNIYLRGSLLYGLRLSNTYEKDTVDFVTKTPGVSGETLLGHGLEVKIAVGYSF